MGETGQNNPNTEWNNPAEQNTGSGQYYGQNADYNNAQYYGANADYNYGQNNGQYYDPNAGYNNGQYYGQNNGYNNGQYYGQNNGYNNGQYYGQNNGYNNGQYYGQNNGYNNGQYYGQNAGYNNGQYYGQNNGQYYGPYYGPFAQPVREPVSNVFYYILMALTAVSGVATVSVTISMIRSLVDSSLLSGIDLDAVTNSYAFIYNYLLDVFSNSQTYLIYSRLNSALKFALLMITITDIVLVRRKGYPIFGMILFAIFCRPGYFLWRAHTVNQKKLVPALFTCFYLLLYAYYFLWCFFFIASLF